ncbi:MAG: response regulator [Candidatus Peribacteraceae bacterium]|jgi:DNA-binding response OmpR family regulator|nr:response regulator [Candidatus Peribacteraceae bacterium]HCI04189.1 hypothetical protein [Candidatus Peribacteria bacterium]|tara:strand:+ start:2979 stop:3365 length:387 start_codon:yes stop_codon:yes gene_type:complete
MKVANILIAEDDDMLRDVYTKKFTIAGFNIIAAKDGEEAIKEVLKMAPDIMIVDLNMPVIDGFGILEKFPKDQREFPIIVLTNFGNEENRDRAMKLGADEYFIKNEMTIKKLLQMVDCLLKAKKIWDK